MFDFNFCNGEVVETVGPFRSTIKDNLDGSGWIHVNYHGKGVGNQGNEYVLNLKQQQKFDLSTGSFQLRDRVISKGGAANMLFTLVLRDGQFKVNEVKCVG